MARAAGLLLILFFTVILLVQFPPVQTLVARKVVNSVEGKISGKISIGQIGIVPGIGLFAKDITLIDTGAAAPDTLCNIGSLTANFSIKDLLGGYLKIRSVSLKDALFHLNSEDNQYKNNLSRALGIVPHDPKPMGSETIFSIGTLKVQNFRFHLTNSKSNAKPNRFGFGMDWTDFEATARDLDVSDLLLSDGRMSGRLSHLEASTSCGYSINHLEATATVGRGQAMIKDLIVNDEWSDIHLEHYAMNFANAKAFQDFINAVSMDAKFERSTVSFKSVRYFAPTFEKSELLLDVIPGGTVTGPVSDLNVRNLRFRGISESLNGTVNRCRITGLPDVHKMNLDFDVDGVTFTSSSLSGFLNNLSKNANLSLGKFATGLPMELRAKGHGTLDDLKVNGDLDGKQTGQAGFDITLNNVIDKSRPIIIAGVLNTNQLHVGKILSNDQIGAASLRGKLSATLAKKHLKLCVDSLKIGNFAFRGYDYSSVLASGELDGKDFELALESSDPNVNLTVSALKYQNSIQASAKIGKLNPDVLNLLKKPSGVAGLSFNLEADIPSIAKGNLDGDVLISGLKATINGNGCDIGDIMVKAGKEDELQRLTLSSQIVRASYLGTGRKMDFEFSLNDRENVISCFIPGLYFAKNTNILFHSDGEGEAIGDISSPKVIFGKNTARNIALTFVNSENNLDASLGSEDLKCGDVIIKNPSLKLNGNYDMSDSETYNIDLNPGKSSVNFNDNHLGIELGKASIRKDGVSIDGFSLGEELRNFKMDGRISKNMTDSLKLVMNNIDMSIIDLITGKDNQIKGVLNAEATVCSPMSSLGFTANALLDSISMKSSEIGSLNLSASLKNKALKFNVANILEGNKLLETCGTLNTQDKEIDAAAAMRDFNVAAVSPFLTGLFSETGGFISGNVSAAGPLKNLFIKSDSLRFDRTRLKLAYTNVAYTINGRIDVSSDKLSLDGITITDDFGGTGSLDGAVRYEGPKKMSLNTRLSLSNLMVLDTDYSSSGNGFYGKAFMGGSASVTGPLNNLKLDISVGPSQESLVYIPLSGSTAAQSNLLTFKKIMTDSDIIIKNAPLKKKKRKGGLDAHVNFIANPTLKAVVDINKSQGHRLDFQGEGLVTIDYSSSASNSLTLGGDYSITNGKYRFSVLNGVIMKDFAIQSGSSVKLNGKPLDTSFDISALYKTKASLAPLTADTTSVSNRRLINCGIKISDKISNPKLKFSIDIPDLDPTTQSMVQSALNTEDKVQQQFVSLLVTGCFIPTEQSGVTFNSNDAVFSNISSIMSGQLNNILSRYNIPVDMGLNYTRNEAGKSIFDVAVSTQLFNNRVIINGSIGNRQNTNNSANVVGDIDIEVKIDKLGKYRVKAFSHSADDYTNFLDNTQRNGVGFSVQTEFDKFSDFFKRLFMGRKKRQEYIIQQAEEAKNVKYKTIKIEK